MKAKRLHTMFKRKRRRTRQPITAPFVAPHHIARALAALASGVPAHNDRTFGTGSDQIWAHIVSGNRVEFIAPARDGFPQHSAVLHQREFENMCAWIRCEFASLDKTKPTKHAQSTWPASYLN